MQITESRKAVEITIIQSIRHLLNAAIAVHNVQPVIKIWCKEVCIVRGNGAVLQGRDAVLAAFEKDFANPDFETYLRTPDNITIAPSGKMAAERGHWQGTWKNDRGDTTSITGLYQTAWRLSGAGWQIQSEHYIPLTNTVE